MNDKLEESSSTAGGRAPMVADSNGAQGGRRAAQRVGGGRSFSEGEAALIPRGAPVQLSEGPGARTGTTGEPSNDSAPEVADDRVGPEQTPDPAAAPEPGVQERGNAVQQALKSLERDCTDYIVNHAQWLSRNWTLFIGSTNGNPSLAYAEADFLRVACAPETKSAGSAAASAVAGKAKSAAIGAAASTLASRSRRRSGSRPSRRYSNQAPSCPWRRRSRRSRVSSGRPSNRSCPPRQPRRHATSRACSRPRRASSRPTTSTPRRSRRWPIGACSSIARVVRSMRLGRTWTSIWSSDGSLRSRPSSVPAERTERCSKTSWPIGSCSTRNLSPGEANDDTSEVAYEDAAKNERVHKLVKAGKPLLFVHQLKFGLLGFGFGLSDHTVCAAIERKAQSLLGNGGVEAVKAATDGLVVSIPRVSNPVAFDRGVQRATAMPLGPEAGTLPNYQGPAGRGNVRSKVTLHVEEDEGCAVLSGLDFISSCIGPDREAYLRGVSTDHSDGGFADIEWEWTP